MKVKCQCGHPLENFSSYNQETGEFIAYHFLCDKCKKIFTIIQYSDGTIHTINGYLGKMKPMIDNI